MQSVEGFSIEYALLNPSGYFFYSIYSIQGRIDPRIGNTGHIETNDLVFVIHGFFLSSFILMQVFLYDRGQHQKKLAKWVVCILALEWITILVVFVIEIGAYRLFDGGTPNLIP